MSDPSRSPLRPAVAPAAAFMLGAAADSPLTPFSAVAVAAIASGGAWALRRRKASALALALAAALALGSARGVLARREAAAARPAWVPADGAPVELEIDGRVLRSPERGEDGSWLVDVQARPARPAETEFAACRLRVVPVPPEAAARLRGLRRDDRIRCWARLRRIDDATELRGSVKNARLVECSSRGGGSPLRLLDEARAALRERLEAAFPADPRTRGVVGAMLLGDRANLDAENLSDLRDGGLLHLLSISGLHVGMLVALLAGALRRSPARHPTAVAIVAIPAVAALAFFTGGEPPVARSALSAAAVLVGRAIGRRGDALNTLALVAAAMSAGDPRVLDDVGFRLTFAATAGLLAFAGPVARAIPLPRPLALSVGVSTGAYLGTAPVSAWTFGRLAPGGILTNLASAPLCAAVMALGAAAIALRSVPFAGPVAAAGAGMAVEAVFGLCRFVGAIPGGAFRVPPASPFLIAAYAAALAWLAGDSAAGREGAWARGRRFALTLLLAALHVGGPPCGAPAGVAVTVFDVGQGQAVAWRGPGGGFVLVDAGPGGEGRFDAGARVVVPGLQGRGCRRLEALVLTHDHDDHTGGAPSVLREMDVGELWIATGSAKDPLTAKIVDRAVSMGVAVRLVARGERRSVAGGVVEVLHPTAAERTLPPNDRGIVLRFLAPGAPAALVPGDAEGDAEGRILRSGLPLRAGLLVAGHHGAARSTSAAFVAAVAPAAAVFSAGAFNRFGHPSVETIRRLSGIPRWRTDRDGTLDFEARDGAWRVGATAR